MALSLFLILLAALPEHVWPVDHLPQSQGRVNDFGRLISDAGEKTLEDTLADLQYRTGITITVATGRGRIVNDEYARRLFDFWRVGEPGENNGVLILVNRTDSAVVLGSRFDQAMNSSEANTLIRQFLVATPDQNDYGNALNKAARALAQKLREPDADLGDQSEYQLPLLGWFAVAVFFGSMAFFPWLGAVFTRSDRRYGGTIAGMAIGVIMSFFGGLVLGGVLLLALGIFGFVLDLLVSRNYRTSRAKQAASSWWAGGRWA